MGRKATLYINDMEVAVCKDKEPPTASIEFDGEFIIDVDKMPDKEIFRLRVVVEKADVTTRFKRRFLG